MSQIQFKNGPNCYSIETVNKAIRGLAALSLQESNFVSHVHSSNFSVQVPTVF